MKRFPHAVGLWVLILFAVAHASEGDRTDLEDREMIAVEMQARLDSLESARSGLLIRAESLARQVNVTRRKDLLGAGEHRLLEKQLQQSQLLGSRIAEIEIQKKTVLNRYRPILETLIRSYQTEIEDLVRRMEMEKDSKSTEALLVRFNDVLRKKQKWETKLSEPEPEPGKASDISAKPWDTPRDLLMKGDLLKDREEGMRKEIRDMDRRLSSLKQEERVRKKAEELAVGMHVFDENEELLGRESPVGTINTFTDKGRDMLGNNPEAGIQGPTGVSHSAEASAKQMTANDPDRISYRTLSDLQEYIDRLQVLKGRLRIQADTLQDQARRFYRAAGERRK